MPDCDPIILQVKPLVQLDPEELRDVRHALDLLISQKVCLARLVDRAYTRVAACAQEPPKKRRYNLSFGRNFGYGGNPRSRHPATGRAGQSPHDRGMRPFAHSTRKCYNCGAEGHTIRECPEPLVR